MKKILLIGTISWFLVSIAIKGNCQYNLVPNPSFELYSTCPITVGQLSNATFWTEPLTNTSPELMHACNNAGTMVVGVPQNYFGHQLARTGLGYAGICNGIDALGQPNNYREYIQIELSDSLLQGVEYTISFYVSAADSCGRYTNNFGAYFSHVEIDTFFSPVANLPFQPQFENPPTHHLNDKIGWELVSGSFTANGGEKFLILGNFRPSQTSTFYLTGWGNVPSNIQAAYLYLDDILVTPSDSITSLFETNSKDELTFSTLMNNNVFEIMSQNENIYSWELINIFGQRINENLSFNNNHLYLNLQEISNGIYFIRLKMQKHNYYILKIFKT